jgi:glutaredoxin 3
MAFRSSRSEVVFSTQTVPITVYVLGGCPHCTRATSLLDRRGIQHEIVSGNGIPGFRRRLQQLTGGSTVPQIVIDGRPIGGADRLARLDRRGVLAALVVGDPLPVTRVRKRRLRRAAACWVAEAFDATGRRVGRAAGRDEESARNALTRAMSHAGPSRAS